MNNWVNDLIDSYYDFLKGRTAVVTETGTNWAVISTPFIGLFNDTLEIYTKRERTAKFLLSDDGVTIKKFRACWLSCFAFTKAKGVVG